jgi:hypothetical protein
MNRLQKWLERKRSLARIRREGTARSDRERIRNILVKEAAYSSALAGFLCHAFNHGRGVRITVQADGEQCGIAILAHAKEPLVEYLAEWACAQKLVKVERLEEFDKRMDAGGRAEMTGPGSWVIRLEEKQILHLPDDLYRRLYGDAGQTGKSGAEKTGPQIDPEGP